MLTLLMAAFVVVASAASYSISYFTVDGKELRNDGANNKVYVNGSSIIISFNGRGLGYVDIDIYAGISTEPTNGYLYNIDSYSKRLENNAGENNVCTLESLAEGDYTIRVSFYEGNNILNGGGNQKGSTLYYHFVVDRTAPTGTLSGVTNHKTTSGSVSFSWSEAGCTATISGGEYNNTPYSSGTVINGTSNKIYRYIITLKDKAGNSYSPWFYIDLEAPTGTLYGVTESGGKTSGSVSFSWNDDGATATISGGGYNGAPYSNGTVINGIANAETKYEITLFDNYNNSNKYSFTIDKKAPVGYLTGVENGGTTGGSVSFAWTETGCTATLNGAPYEKGSAITGVADAVNTYTVVLTDACKNSTSYTFTINRKNPVLNLYETPRVLKYDGFITPLNVYFQWDNTTEAGTCTVRYKKDSGDWVEGYLQVYYYNIEAPDTKYADEASALEAITSIEKGTIVRIDAWDSDEWEGKAEIYSQDISRAQEGQPCYLYRGIIFFTESFLNNYLDSCVEDLCKKSSQNLLTEEGEYTVQITSQYGISVQKTFTIDKTAPTGTLTTSQENGFASIQDNEYYTNGTVTFTYTDGTATLYTSSTSESAPYVSGTSINGTPGANTDYIITLTDKAGNTTQYYIYIYRALPSGTLKTTQNGGFRIGTDDTLLTNGTVKLVYNALLYSAFLDGEPYESGTAITAEASYELRLYDAAQNVTVYTFAIDRTAPTGELVGVENGATTGGSVSFTWSEADCTATLNGEPYANGTSINGTPGVITDYEIILTDLTGNPLIVSFTIDREAPDGVLKANGKVIPSGSSTNKDVSFTWSEAGCTATLNGEPYASGTAITAEASYEILLTDTFGNSTTYTFEIDKTAPVGELVGVENNGATKEIVSFIWEGNNNTLQVNGTEVIGSIQADGSFLYTILPVEDASLTYYLKLTDDIGNFSEYTVTVDCKAPEGELNGYFNASGKTNKDVSFTWSEAGASATLNGNNYISGTAISQEGSHLLVLVDSVGNSTELRFTIDKTAPVGELVGVENNGATKSSVKFKWSEAGCTATLNGENYTKNAEISAEATYVITLTDDIGNTNTYTFEIDKTAPVGELVGVENGGITKENVILSWSEAGCTATLNGAPYESGTAITAEASYELRLYDAVQNVTVYTFEIDKTAPVGELVGVINGGATTGSVSFTWAGDYYTATLNGEPYESGTAITAEASYELKLYDEVQNVTVYTFAIDRTAPTGELVGVTNGGITSGSVSFTWSEAGCTATLNGEAYASGTAITAEASYELRLYDAAQNVTVYSFEIDATKPAITFSQTYNEHLGSLYFNTAFSITWSEAGASATLNGNNYISGTLISDENLYELVITDLAGNTAEYSLVLDTSSYTENKEYFASQGKDNPAKWYQTYCYTITEDKFNQGGYFAFSNYEDAKKYATARENKIVRMYEKYTGGAIICPWTNEPIGADVLTNSAMLGNSYSIYFDINDEKSFIAYFNQANLNAAIQHYAEQSVEELYIPESTAPAFPGEGDIPPQELSRKAIYISGSSIAFRKSPSGVTLYVDGYISSYSTPLTVGYHEIKEVDIAGNACEYIVVVDNSAPGIVCVDAAGNLLPGLNEQFSSSPEIFASQVFSIIPNDNFDDIPLLSITFNGKKINCIGEKYTFQASGFYEIELYDVALNKASFTLYISLEAPTVEASDVVSSKGTFLGKNFTINTIYPNEIRAIAIARYDADAMEWKSLTVDSEGKDVTKDNLSYYIATSGLFKITLTDIFNRTVEKQIEIYKDAPVGKIFSADGFELLSGSHTQKNIYFTWEDDECTAYIISGDKTLEYNKKSYITEEGVYTIKLVNLSNNSSLYTVVIDRTAPTASILKSEGNNTFTDLANGGYSNKAVKITWSLDTEPLTTATFRKNKEDYLPYTNGALITEDGYYTVKLTDAAGNSRSYSFEIDKTIVSVSIVSQDNIILQNGALTNQSFYFVWSETGCTATLGGQAYTSKTLITDSGVYSFYIEDKFGNYAYYTVTVDKTAPVGELVGVTNGGSTKANVILSWSEAGCTATLNGAPYESGTAITAEASYELRLYDAAQNVTVYTFEIDKTAPVGELVGVTNGGITNGSVYCTWKESGITVTLNGEEYTKRTEIAAENSYLIVLTDKTGNSTELRFTIDKTAPVGELVGAVNNGFTNSDVLFVWHEAGCTATLNGEPYESGTAITAEASYELRLYDAAQNVTVYSFEIDKTAPIGSFLGTGYQDGAMYVFSTSVQFTWSESYITAKLDGDDYKKRDIISAQDFYRLELTDRAGNSTVYVFEIDLQKPEGELVGNYNLVNGIYYFKEAFSFVWEETNCTATLDGNEYLSGDLITDEASYVIVLKDCVGNYTEIKAVLDKTAPVAEFSSPYNTVNGVLYFKSSFFVNWNGTEVTATLNDINYVKKSYIEEEKSFALVLSDLSGNTSTYSMVLDTTAPTVLFSASAVNNFGTLYFKNKFQISWLESEITATLNGNYITNNSIVSIEQNYELQVVDRAGNSTKYSLVLDTTAPVGELVGVTNGGISNASVSFKWSEAGCTATLNGENYKKGSNISSPDTYVILIYDIAGNFTEYTFVLDFEVPVGELVGVTNGGITKGDVFFTWSSEGLTATLNGEPYAKGHSIIEEKLHTIILTSEAGNSTTYTFEIDKTAPVGELIGVENGGITKSTVLFKWSEAGCTATLNDVDFDKNSYISEEGTHLLVLTDRAGNSTELRFTIDREAPVGYLTGVENGGITKENVILSWSETGCTATLNGAPYESGTAITAEASYELRLYDAVQNVTVYTFEIDKTAPVGELVGVTNGGITNGSVYCTWKENGITVTLNGENYTKKTVLTADNTYLLVLVDRAGNSAELRFTIDREAPVGYLTGVENGGITNGSVSFSWSEAGCTATLNGEPYANGSIISEERTYTIILKDICQNVVSFTFTIDKTAPTGKLVGVTNDGITNNNVRLEFSREYTAYLNDISYNSGVDITEEGSYVLRLYDAAQNVTVYSFEIDKTAPVGSFSSSSTSVLGLQFYPKNTSFIWSDEGCTATLNGFEYTFGTPITEDNSYELRLYDAAQNVTVYSFIIDATAPVGELVGVTNGGYTTESVSLSWSETEVSATLNGNNYKKGTSVFEEKKHLIELKDIIGNRSIYTFTIDKTAPVFSVGEERVSELVLKDGISLTLTVIETNLKSIVFNGVEYSESITINASELQEGNYEAVAEDLAGNITKISVIVNKTAPILIFNDEYITNASGNFFIKNTSFDWEENDIIATLNGEPYKKNSTIYSDGAYTLTLTDRAGNSTTFNFNILTKLSLAPLSYTLEDNSVETVDTKAGENYSSTTPLTVNLPTGSTVYVNGEIIIENYLLSTPGVYTVKSENAAGVAGEYTVTIEAESADEGNSTNGADIALIVVGSGSGAGVIFTIFKGFFKKKKLKIKRL